jgi:hypothetical protein
LVIWPWITIFWAKAMLVANNSGRPSDRRPRESVLLADIKIG